MINIFKKQKTQYPAIVEEIHNEFGCASDVLMREAEAALQQIKEAPIEKASRLEKLGFKKSKEVVETKEVVAQKALSEETIELVKHYKRNYPFNKFITEDMVTSICEKYGLICGDVDRYKGFVPETKLKQIEDFKLKKEDFIPVYRYGYSEKTEEELLSVHTRDFVVKHVLDHNKISGKRRAKLKICAPLKDMDTSGMRIENHRLKDIPDPVVLQPVRGGYLILAMWADENFDPAKEPTLINEIMN